LPIVHAMSCFIAPDLDLRKTNHLSQYGKSYGH
jgi:hypothetical protein